jgi:hypothetical protein
MHFLTLQRKEVRLDFVLRMEAIGEKMILDARYRILDTG